MRVFYAARLLFTAVVFAAMCARAAPAAAVTVDQIVSLSKAGVSEAVILALLDRDRSVLTIAPEQIVTLKRDGLSDTLIAAMLKSGRDEGEEAAREVASWNAASILSSLNATPGVVIVGHGPDRPNTTHTEDWYSGYRDGVRLSPGHRGSGWGYTAPYRSPYRGGLNGRAFQVPRADPFGPSERGESGDRMMLCLAQVNTSSGPGPSYITECPSVMQRSPRTR